MYLVGIHQYNSSTQAAEALRIALSRGIAETGWIERLLRDTPPRSTRSAAPLRGLCATSRTGATTSPSRRRRWPDRMWLEAARPPRPTLMTVAGSG